MSGPVPVRSGRRSPGDVFQRIVHGSREAGRLRRTLRSKLGGGNEGNNGTRGQRNSFLLANPAASIRLEVLLVRRVRSNPVRKNRALGRWQRQEMRQVVP